MFRPSGLLATQVAPEFSGPPQAITTTRALTEALWRVRWNDLLG